MQPNIVLIGMPGAGKSTVGVLVAKELAKEFIDTDILIQSHAQTTLQTILDEQGYMALRKIEEQMLLSGSFKNHVVATGGSAVYSHIGMVHLKKSAIVIYLDVSLSDLKSRINNYETRGIAKTKDQSFTDLYEERRILYSKYADYRVDCEKLDTQQTVAQVVKVHTTLAKLHRRGCD